MSDLNQVTLTGRLTRDPELRYAPSGTAIANIGVACDNSYTKDGQKQENTVFVDAVAFAGGAEFVGRHGYKGQKVALTGALNLERWEDKQTGQPRTKLSIKIREFVPMEWKPRDGEQLPPQAGSSPTVGNAPSPSAPDDDDDVPF